ncbi:MAG: hypothetical protein H6728_17240 [Myxococcales bacterium]|nr:hypothetical protein [Myxococcales bacterium]MCB9644820.1 hypothetical protein [Myxococcales bacterium]
MRFWLVGVGLLFPLMVQASPISDPALRRKLALTYAPEIRQDQKERYGIASIPYFLMRSDLMAMLRGCTRAKRRNIAGYLKKRFWSQTPRVRLGRGTWLMLRDRFRWYTDTTCDVMYAPFSPGKIKNKTKTILGGPSNVFLQLRRRDDASLLRGAYRFAVVPEISFRTYERQVLHCKRKNLFRMCVEEEVRRYYIIQYFVPLMLNDACNVHEGEHEGMAVLVDARKFLLARTPNEQREAIIKVAYYGHYKTKLYPTKKVTFVEGTHPVGFMGSLGHAIYPTSGKSDMSRNFPFEVRPWVVRICKKKKRFAYLTEWHRGNGPVYQLWKAKTGVLKRGLAEPAGGWLDWRGIRKRGLGIPSNTKRPSDGKKRKALFEEDPVCCKGVPANVKLMGTTRPASGPSSRKMPTTRIFEPRPAPKKLRRTAPHEAGTQPLSVKERKLLRKIPAFFDRCLSPVEQKGVRLCDVQAGPNNPTCCLQKLWREDVRWVRFAGRWGSQESFASGMTGAAAANLGRVMRRWPLASSLGNSGPFGPRWIHQTTWHWVDPTKAPAATPSVWR